jgi:hypothetical protein
MKQSGAPHRSKLTLSSVLPPIVLLRRISVNTLHGANGVGQMEAQSVAIPLFVVDSTRCSRLSSGQRKAAIGSLLVTVAGRGAVADPWRAAQAAVAAAGRRHWRPRPLAARQRAPGDQPGRHRPHRHRPRAADLEVVAEAATLGQAAKQAIKLRSVVLKRPGRERGRAAAAVHRWVAPGGGQDHGQDRQGHPNLNKLPIITLDRSSGTSAVGRECDLVATASTGLRQAGARSAQRAGRASQLVRAVLRRHC